MELEQTRETILIGDRIFNATVSFMALYELLFCRKHWLKMENPILNAHTVQLMKNFERNSDVQKQGLVQYIETTRHPIDYRFVIANVFKTGRFQEQDGTRKTAKDFWRIYLKELPDVKFANEQEEKNYDAAINFLNDHYRLQNTFI